jgi:uncharacterized protein
MYQNTVNQFAKVLGNLKSILQKGAEYAESKKVDPEVLPSSRLAPDQFNLARQVQIACDTAKLGVARLTNKEAPSHADTEKTIPELRVRIQSTVDYLKQFSEKDFAQAATRQITQPRWEGKFLTGEEYLHQHLIPNFYFHVTTAYSILRHNGVAVGKKDYLGELPYKKPL